MIVVVGDGKRCVRVGSLLGRRERTGDWNQREFREVGRGVAPAAGEVGLAVDLWGRREWKMSKAYA